MENWNKNGQEEKDLKVACNCNGRFNLYFLGNSKLQVEMKWLEGMICQFFFDNNSVRMCFLPSVNQ